MKNIKIVVLSWLLVGFAYTGVHSQTNNIPAPQQSEGMALIGATIHIGDGTVIENGTVVFAEGKITAIGKNGEVSVNEDYLSINLDGKHIYPGFILPSTDMGLVEVSSVRATDDGGEIGQYNPNIRAIVAYNTDSELPPTMRYNGILTAQITPSGGIVSGQSSVVQLDAWNWEDAAIKTDDGIHINWPSKLIGARWWMGETRARKNERYEPIINEISDLLKEAEAFSKSPRTTTNLKLEAMEGLFDGSKGLFIHTNDATSIIESVTLAKAHGIERIVIVGGDEALLVANFLKEQNIPMVLADVHALPGEDHDDTVMPYKLPAELHKAGVEFCFGFGGRMTSRARNLAFYAGTAVAYGLPYEEAIKGLTSNAAKILSIDDITGSLAIGKEATLFVSSGDALDMRSNNLEHIFISGRAVQLEATQQKLYKKYSDKYGHDID